MASTLDRKPGAATSRLPSADEASRGRQVLLGVLALVGTAVIVVGVPIALLSVFGTPWPDERPSMEWLTSPTTTETMLSVLAGVVWIAWLHFVLCLVVEAVAAFRRRGLAPSVPGGGLGTQALARNLVIAITVLIGATAGAVGPASAAMAPEAPAHTQSQVGSTAGTVDEASSQVRSGGDHAAAGERTAGRLDAVPAPGQLDPATQADLNAGKQAFYEVQPPFGRHYDTLWDIAERYLGDGLRYKEIWELNKGLAQPDGRLLENPDLIYPGWVMRLPGDATGPGLKVVDHAEVLPPEGGSSEGGSPAPDAESGAPAPSAEPAAEAASDGVQIFDSAYAPIFGVAGGLALGGAFLAVRRRRASWGMAQMWSAVVSGPTDPPPDPDGGGGGPRPAMGLRNEADPDLADWVDRALRSSALGPAMPPPARVSVGPTGLALAFDRPPKQGPPQGWSTSGERIWTLRIDQDPHRVETPSPVPGLVTIGRRDDDSLLLVDLEGVPGVTALEGADDTARGLAVSIALDTATHPWADACTVTMVGFADDLSRVGDGRLRHVAAVDRVLEELDNLARYQRAACLRVGVDNAREGRMRAPDEFPYHLVVCSGLPSESELTRLEELAADPKVSLAVVVIGDRPGAGLRLSAQPDGRLTSPLHGIEVQAQVVDAEPARAVAALYETPPARGVTFDEWVATVAADSPAEVSAETRVRVGVLGPVTLEAPGDVDPDRREFLTELACFVALHPDGAHVNRISGALWPRGADENVRDSALRQLADWLGTTPDGTPVLVENTGVWRLVPGSVDLDWSRFRSLVNAASNGSGAGDRQLSAALQLVRGVPFAGVPTGRYGWLETLTAETDMRLAICLTTLAAANAAARRDDPEGARAVLTRAVAVLPANQELWRARLRLEKMFGQRDDLVHVADQMYAALATHGAGGPSGETDALVDDLLPGYRSDVA